MKKFMVMMFILLPAFAKANTLVVKGLSCVTSAQKVHQSMEIPFKDGGAHLRTQGPSEILLDGSGHFLDQNLRFTRSYEPLGQGMFREILSYRLETAFSVMGFSTKPECARVFGARGNLLSNGSRVDCRMPFQGTLTVDYPPVFRVQCGFQLQ